MSNETLVQEWQGVIIGDCRRILNRELAHLELTFITSRGGFMALEMIQDYVRSLTGKPEELERYLRSESAPDC